MATDKQIFKLTFPPGITRDGTRLSARTCVDGQWVRFEDGLPAKIGGYKEVSMDITEIPRGAYAYAKDGLIYIYGFGAGKSFITVISEDISTGVTSETALPDLPDSDLYTYQIAVMFDATSGAQRIIAHPSKNLDDISNDDATNIYIANIGENPPTWNKVADGSGGFVTVSGGIVVLQPFLFYYGSEGFIGNSNANLPNNSVVGPGKAANAVNVAGTKIVKGLPLRGSGGSTAGLFWSLDSVIRATFVGGGTGFKYETISSQSSILSASSVIEYDGAYFWIGIDRFLAYTGVVKEVQNSQNMDWFFDNVNYNQRSKIWATKVPRYGEIWWFFPAGTATECTHAIIYNVRGNFWFDVELPRSAGYFSQVFKNPIMFGNTLNNGGKYSAFVHEFRRNAIYNNSEVAIPAYFETPDIGVFSGGTVKNSDAVGLDRWTRITRVEPDFAQVGPMKLEVIGEQFANGGTLTSEVFTFEPTDGKIDIHEQRRQLRLKFESNIIDGDFRMGHVVLHTEPGDRRS